MWNPTIEAIACEFAARIRAEFDTATLCEIRRRNALPEYRRAGACATHDFCDSNVLMGAAFQAVMMRESCPASDQDAVLWDSAWDRARSSGFTAGVANLPPA